MYITAGFKGDQCGLGEPEKAILETQPSNFEENLDNPLKRTKYAKFCMSPSLGGTLPESVIPQLREQLSTEFVRRFLNI